jgi:hypothetical protein
MAAKKGEAVSQPGSPKIRLAGGTPASSLFAALPSKGRRLKWKEEK